MEGSEDRLGSNLEGAKLARWNRVGVGQANGPWIAVDAVDKEFVVKMGASGPAGCANVANDLTLFNPTPHFQAATKF